MMRKLATGSVPKENISSYYGAIDPLDQILNQTSLSATLICLKLESISTRKLNRPFCHEFVQVSVLGSFLWSMVMNMS